MKVSANYLSENQKDEFKEYAEKMIKMARQNETGVVGGSATSLHPSDNKPATTTVLQKEGGMFVILVSHIFIISSYTDNKTLEPFKPTPVEKMDSGHNKLQEKSKLGTPVGGVDSVTKPVDPGPAKVTIGSQTSMDCESQADQVDSPPPSPPTTTSGVSTQH